MDKEFEILLQKYRNGQISFDEEIILADKLSDRTNKEVEYYLKNDLQGFLNNPDSHHKELSHSLNEIHHRIRLLQSERKRKLTHRLFGLTMKVAASLFLPLLALSIFFFIRQSSTGHDTLVRIVAPKGARVHFELPDGTTGVLNGGSELCYPSLFTDNKRVRLTGEAYFDVAKTKQQPFVVDVNENEVIVTGTRFSLSARPYEKNTELVLEEGSVMFKTRGSKSGIKVEPGQRIVEKNGNITREDVDPWKYTAWKDGKLIFRDDPIVEVASRISEWYNVDVEVEGKGFEEYRLRGVFEDDSIEEVLRLLKMTSYIDYVIHEREARKDGSFTRKKITLMKK